MKSSKRKKALNDSAWKILLDETELTKNRKEAEEKYRDLSKDHVRKLRQLCKTDLFFLAGGPLEYELLSPGLHGHYCRWLKSVWGERYRMTLLPRDHYKSTTNTIADTIQMILPNDAGVQEWPYLLGPNIKVLLAHENRESASRFLYEIMKAFRAKPLMLALFPEMIPSPRVQRMNKWELELPRNAEHKEPTVDTIGVGGAAQGRHYNWIKLDDLVGEDARDSNLVMQRVFMWFDNINSILTRLRLDGWDIVGTRWAASDVYSHAIKMYGINKKKSVLRIYDEVELEKVEDGSLVVYARGAVENGQPIFPEEFSIEDLNRLRKNPWVWASQYANNPRDMGLTKLDPAWLKFYNIGSGSRLIVFDGEESRSVYIRDLDRVVMIDPSVGESSSSDETGFVVTGTDHKLNIYVLEAYKKRLKAPELIEEMIKLYMKWSPRVISIEGVAFAAMLKHWFDERCRALGIYPSIHDYKPGNRRSKTARIEGLANYAAGGQLYILEGMHQLRDEWEWFPIGESDHILDALAQGPDVWTPSVVKESKHLEEALKVLSESRDGLTGYSIL